MLRGLFQGELEVDSDSEDLSEEKDEVPTLKRKINPVKIAEEVAKTNTVKLHNNNEENLSSSKLDKACSSTSAGETELESGENYVFVKRRKLLDCSFQDEMISKEDIELRISGALSRGEIEIADKLNDQLIQKELSIQLKQAEKARSFQEKRNKRLQEKVKNKKKKLNWTFETKKRWETKSNM